MAKTVLIKLDLELNLVEDLKILADRYKMSFNQVVCYILKCYFRAAHADDLENHPHLRFTKLEEATWKRLHKNVKI